jgi:PEP-CTERM motif-containing protein
MQITARTTTKLKKAVFLLAVLTIIGLAERTANADPLVFSNVKAFQNNDTVQVDLLANPGTTLIGTALTFSVDISGILAPGATDILRITYTELGSAPIVQEFQIPLFGVVNPPLTLIFSVVSPNTNPFAVPATLTLDLLSSNPDFVIPAGQSVNSFTYSFNVQPVPEPATILALAGSLAALGFRVRRRPE